MSETPRPKPVGIWHERERERQERERQRQEDERLRLAANEESRRRDERLALPLRRFSELARAERELAAFVESITFDTDPAALAQKLTLLDAYRRVLALAPDEVKPSPKVEPDAEAVGAARSARRERLEREVREWSGRVEEIRADLRERREPPPDERQGRALLAWRSKETLRTDFLESELRRLENSIADATRELGRLQSGGGE